MLVSHSKEIAREKHKFHQLVKQPIILSTFCIISTMSSQPFEKVLFILQVNLSVDTMSLIWLEKYLQMKLSSDQLEPDWQE